MAYIVQIKGKFVDSNNNLVAEGDHSFDTIQEATNFANSLIAPPPSSPDDVVGGTIAIL
jgi:hypothetical protein